MTIEQHLRESATILFEHERKTGHREAFRCPTCSMFGDIVAALKAVVRKERTTEHPAGPLRPELANWAAQQEELFG